MSPELESIFSQVQQLDNQSQSKLINHLTRLHQAQSKSLEQSRPGETNSNDNPWLAIAGSLVDDPLFEDYLAAIDQYRADLDRQELENQDNSTT